MAKREGEKSKLIILANYLYENTDENHTVSVEPDDGSGLPSMQDYLESRLGYRPDARGIRRDLALIGKGEPCSPFFTDGTETMELDLRVKGRGRYYIGERELSLEEVKLLIDVVRSSNFITASKTEALVKKLTGFASRHQRASLNREVHVRNRVKAKNEDVFGNINTISDAINSNRRISFRYFRYTVKNGRLGREYRHGGKIYEVSPYTLIWVDQNYYMLAYSSEEKRITTFRVDRMSAVSVSDKVKEGREEFEKTDMSTFTTKVFHMFRTSDPENVTLRFTDSLLDSIVDRFGDETVIIPDGDGLYSTTVNVCVSPQFYGWLAGFGRQIEVKGPPGAREAYRDYIREIWSGYDEK